MQVDFLTLACLRDSMDALLGARVQQIVLADRLSVGLELYTGRRFHLLASAQSQSPRVVVAPSPIRRGVDQETPLVLLLRKWIKQSRLVDVSQPPWERILALHFQGRAGECRLVVELIGRYSNIILVDSNERVLEAAKHVGPAMSRYRSILPGQPYRPPPPPDGRRAPTELDALTLKDMLERAPQDEPLDRWLMQNVLGVSRVIGREVGVRATGYPEGYVGSANAKDVHAALSSIYGPLKDGWWSPHVGLDDTGSVIAFTAFEPRQFPRAQAFEDISEAMWCFFETRSLVDSYAAARNGVGTLISEIESRLDGRLAKLEEQLSASKNADSLRVAGELLLTYQRQVPAAAETITLPDAVGQSRSIVLDPRRTPVENAQEYFRKYRKAKRAARQIPDLMKMLTSERQYLDQLRADLEMAESRPEIDAVRAAFAAPGWTPKQHKIAGQVRGPRQFESDGFVILVGRNADQNEHITFVHAGAEDLWLHVSGMPGAHVVIKRGRQQVPQHVVRFAAQLAAYYSVARAGESHVDVDVTERRFVRRARGKFPGIVTYRRERTLHVKPGIDATGVPAN